ncbi:hypothetical protein PM082_014298 [Marasmius tenuissimus]|nr:hypothetical protein PM082_014298 [Marasmius tenuissimus]
MSSFSKSARPSNTSWKIQRLRPACHQLEERTLLLQTVAGEETPAGFALYVPYGSSGSSTVLPRYNQQRMTGPRPAGDDGQRAFLVWHDRNGEAKSLCHHK